MKIVLRDKRESAGISRRDLVRDSGVSRRTISRIELDHGYEPGVFTTKRLANALGVNVDDLIHEEHGSAVPTGRGKKPGVRTAAVDGSPDPVREGE